MSTSSSTFTIKWSLPSLNSTPVNGCEITSYRVQISSDNGASFSEVDSGLVRDKPNLLQHTLATSNFNAGNLGATFIVRVQAVNDAGVLTSSGLAVVLADVPLGPTVAPQLVQAETSTSKLTLLMTAADGANTT